MRRSHLAIVFMCASLASAALACGDDGGEESCFEVQPKRDDTIGVCGYSNAELVELAGNRDTRTRSSCFALSACPDACPADEIIATEVQPELEADMPDFMVQDAFPLCREDDVAAQQCCFWVLFAGLDGA